MSAGQKVAWGTIISALVAAGAVAVFVANSRAEAVVSPVKERVAKVETRQDATDKQLEKMDGKLDKVLEKLDRHMEQH